MSIIIFCLKNIQIYINFDLNREERDHLDKNNQPICSFKLMHSKKPYKCCYCNADDGAEVLLWYILHL